MSADPSASEAGERRRHPVMERRGSWWKRVTSKMNKMKRRTSERPATPVAGASATRAIEPVALPVDQILSEREEVATPEPAYATATTTVPMVITPLAEDTVLLAAETEDEAEESLLPMLSSRTGITQDRARDLFAKYGMDYGSARSKQPITSEPPTKIRRVEKPVRLRVHWTCHECSRQFGMEKTCYSCGHRRCRDCTRHPPKRVREVLENTRRELELQEPIFAEPTETASVVDLDLQRYQLEPSAPAVEQQPHAIVSEEPEAGPSVPPRASAGTIQPFPLELDDDVDNEEEVDIHKFEFTVYARPRAGMSAVLKPKAQLVRRQCHKCETQFLPPGRYECQNCGHQRCELCPRYPPKKTSAPEIQAVQRVYRKPRQRVRYTCEHCNTLFMDSDRCFDCGHERCGNCTREPPKRAPERHDPAVVQAVADRLANYGGGFSPLGITASAG